MVVMAVHQRKVAVVERSPRAVLGQRTIPEHTQFAVMLSIAIGVHPQLSVERIAGVYEIDLQPASALQPAIAVNRIGQGKGFARIAAEKAKPVHQLHRSSPACLGYGIGRSPVAT